MLRPFRMNRAVLLLAFVSLGCSAPREARTFKIATYNVENLFDLARDGTEYVEFVPGTARGWNDETFRLKIDRVARVIRDVGADVVALQEIETKRALLSLRDRLRDLDRDYPHLAIADSKATSVKCAVLSRFPIVRKKEIPIAGDTSRNILKVTLAIDGRPLILFNNHWKSKSNEGFESRRMAYALALKKEIDKLKEGTDYVLAGDFNANYNEYHTFLNDPDLNDTSGRTGINHVLATLAGSRLVDEAILTGQPAERLHYNLWLEIDEERRWSQVYAKNRNSPDALILPAELYDERGISYVDNSFDRFDPCYLFLGAEPYRWRMDYGAKDKHRGEGYSDHLPLYALFSTEPFHFKAEDKGSSRWKEASVAGLYLSRTGTITGGYRLKECAVIYKHGNSAIIKQRDGRAIYVYKAGRSLEQGKKYDLTVKKLDNYHGLCEITAIDEIRETGAAGDLDSYLLGDDPGDLSRWDRQNEVVAAIEGIYREGYFHYGKNEKISLHFKDKTLKPKEGSSIILKKVRIGHYQSPQLVVEKREQIEFERKN